MKRNVKGLLPVGLMAALLVTGVAADFMYEGERVIAGESFEYGLLSAYKIGLTLLIAGLGGVLFWVSLVERRLTRVAAGVFILVGLVAVASSTLIGYHFLTGVIFRPMLDLIPRESFPRHLLSTPAASHLAATSYAGAMMCVVGLLRLVQRVDH